MATATSAVSEAHENDMASSDYCAALTEARQKNYFSSDLLLLLLYLVSAIVNGCATHDQRKAESERKIGGNTAAMPR